MTALIHMMSSMETTKRGSEISLYIIFMLKIFQDEQSLGKLNMLGQARKHILSLRRQAGSIFVKNEDILA